MAESTPEKKLSPIERTPTFKLLINPGGGRIAFNVDDERFEEFLSTQKPIKVKPQNWYREADEGELLAYMEETGHFFHPDDRAEWERKSQSKLAVEFRARAAKAQAAEALVKVLK